MVSFAYQLEPQTSRLGNLVAIELNSADPQRFSRISVRGRYCGFVELDGVVSSYYTKALALQIARRVPDVADVVDLIRVVPVNERNLASR